MKGEAVTRQMLNMSLLDSLVERIVAAVEPERIILFGSWARGDARPDSDIDLLIQVPTGCDVSAVVRHIYEAIRPLRAELQRGVDIVVKERSFIEAYGDLVGTIVRPALREGRVLYDR